MNKAAAAWSLVSDALAWAQLDPGPLRTQVERVDLGPIAVERRTFNLSLNARGDLNPGRLLLAITADPQTSVHWFGAESGYADLASSGGSFDVTTTGPATVYCVSLDLDRLAGSGLGLAQAAARHGASACCVRNAVAVQRLRRSIRTCLRAHRIAGSRYSRGVPEELERALAAALQAVEQRPVANGSRSLSRRVAAVRACEAYLGEHLEGNPSLLELSAASGLRPRSLFNAFHAVTGLSPMAYLRRIRLNNVRRILSRTETPHTRIIDVAADFGFWHMGHFTADYRDMFGESPSETLRRARAAAGVS